MRRGLGIVVIFLTVSAAVANCATHAGQAQEAFGSGPQVLWVSAWEFVHSSGGYMETLAGNVQFSRPSVSTGAWRGPLRLPAGAQIEALRCFFYSDGDGTRPNTNIAIYDFDLVTKDQDTPLLGGVTSPQAIGYHEPEAPISPSSDSLVRYQPTNSTHRYYFILLSHQDVEDGFRGCEVTWHRTVSDAPLSPTFADVPAVDPFFQAIEALAAAGVTAGCGDGTNYCPNDPVTRAQLAAFLAKALGLHWAN